MTGAGRGRAAMADQVNADDAMVGGELRSDIVPPINRGAEAVDEDDRRAVPSTLTLAGTTLVPMI
jgi:hypothetical protein